MHIFTPSPVRKSVRKIQINNVSSKVSLRRKTLFAAKIPPSRYACHRLDAIKVMAWRLGPHSGGNICPRSSRYGTHNGYPLCYELPRSSLKQSVKGGKGSPEVNSRDYIFRGLLKVARRDEHCSSSNSGQPLFVQCEMSEGKSKHER